MVKHIVIAAALICGCSPIVVAQTAHLILDSQPGDGIGQGKHYDLTYTPFNSHYFHAGCTPFSAAFDLGTISSGSSNTFVQIVFRTVNYGSPLTPGYYGDAEDAPFEQPGHPGFDVSFQNRGGVATGNFTIYDFTFDENNVMQSFSATFEQHEDNLEPALFGSITYVVPEPSSLVLLGFGALSFLAFSKRLSRC